MRPILPTIVPAAVVGLAFLVFLGYRFDYFGHYAAGYGGTLTALSLIVGAIASDEFENKMPLAVWVTVFVCICGGAYTEATLFNIAKFDEVDFINQSLGAVLAGLGLMSNCRDQMPDASFFRATCYAGLIALHLGFYFAMF